MTAGREGRTPPPQLRSQPETDKSAQKHQKTIFFTVLCIRVLLLLPWLQFIFISPSGFTARTRASSLSLFPPRHPPPPRSFSHSHTNISLKLKTKYTWWERRMHAAKRRASGRGEGGRGLRATWELRTERGERNRRSHKHAQTHTHTHTNTHTYYKHAR